MWAKPAQIAQTVDRVHATSPRVELTAIQRDTLRRLAPSVTVVPSIGADGAYDLTPSSSIGAVRISSGTYPNAITIDGMPGCQLWVPDDFSLPFVAYAGSSFVPLPLPAEPRYSGAWLYTQSVLLAPGANAVGVLLSNRLDLRVGVF